MSSLILFIFLCIVGLLRDLPVYVYIIFRGLSITSCRLLVRWLMTWLPLALRDLCMQTDWLQAVQSY